MEDTHSIDDFKSSGTLYSKLQAITATIGDEPKRAISQGQKNLLKFKYGYEPGLTLTFNPANIPNPIDFNSKVSAAYQKEVNKGAIFQEMAGEVSTYTKENHSAKPKYSWIPINEIQNAQGKIDSFTHISPQERKKLHQNFATQVSCLIYKFESIGNLTDGQITVEQASVLTSSFLSALLEIENYLFQPILRRLTLDTRGSLYKTKQFCGGRKFKSKSHQTITDLTSTMDHLVSQEKNTQFRKEEYSTAEYVLPPQYQPDFSMKVSHYSRDSFLKMVEKVKACIDVPEEKKPPPITRTMPSPHSRNIKIISTPRKTSPSKPSSSNLHHFQTPKVKTGENLNQRIQPSPSPNLSTSERATSITPKTDEQKITTPRTNSSKNRTVSAKNSKNKKTPKSTNRNLSNLSSPQSPQPNSLNHIVHEFQSRDNEDPDYGFTDKSDRKKFKDHLKRVLDNPENIYMESGLREISSEPAPYGVETQIDSLLRIFTPLPPPPPPPPPEKNDLALPEFEKYAPKTIVTQYETGLDLVAMTQITVADNGLFIDDSIPHEHEMLNRLWSALGVDVDVRLHIAAKLCLLVSSDYGVDYHFKALEKHTETAIEFREAYHVLKQALIYEPGINNKSKATFLADLFTRYKLAESALKAANRDMTHILGSEILTKDGPLSEMIEGKTKKLYLLSTQAGVTFPYHI